MGCSALFSLPIAKQKVLAQLRALKNGSESPRRGDSIKCGGEPFPWGDWDKFSARIGRFAHAPSHQACRHRT